MGMFDYVRCEVPLPDGFKGELQTKDMPDMYMMTHVINKCGRLMREVLLRVETVPREERPYPNGKGILELCGSVRSITEMRDADYHGILNFYGSEISGYEPDEAYSPEGRPMRIWHEYNAKFTDGNLVGIALVSS